MFEVCCWWIAAILASLYVVLSTSFILLCHTIHLGVFNVRDKVGCFNQVEASHTTLQLPR